MIVHNLKVGIKCRRLRVTAFVIRLEGKGIVFLAGTH